MLIQWVWNSVLLLVFFIISLGRALNQGAGDPLGRLRGPRSHSAPIILPNSWPLCLDSLFGTLTLLHLYLCAWCSALIALLWSTMVDPRALSSCLWFFFSYYSWFTANFLEHLWGLAFDLILFSTLNSPKVMLALLWLQYICWWLSFAVLSCLSFVSLVPTSHPFGLPVGWRILDYGKNTILNLNHNFKRPRMWNVDSALNVCVTVCWVIFYLNFKSILYILVHYGGFPPLPSGEDYKKIALVSIWILSLKKTCHYTHTHTHTYNIKFAILSILMYNSAV